MNLKEQVFDIIGSLSAAEKINLSDNLQEDIGLDSLGLVMLLFSIEDSFSIELQESDMNPYDLITVGDVVDLAEEYVKPQ